MIVLVVEGPDGVGKTVLAKRIVDALKDRHVNAEYMHFPNYDYSSGSTIKDFLFGKFGNFRDTPTEMQTWLYALDRFCWQNTLSEEDRKSKVFVCDRYYTSSMIYQCANLYYRYKFLRLRKQVEKMEDMDASKMFYPLLNPENKVDKTFHFRDLGVGSWLYEERFLRSSGDIRSIADYMQFAIARETEGMGVHPVDLVIGLDGPDEVIMSRKDEHVEKTGIAKDNFEDDENYVTIVNDMARMVMKDQRWPVFDVTDPQYSDKAIAYVIEHLPLTPAYIIQ